jgi:hypothetical protein
MRRALVAMAGLLVAAGIAVPVTAANGDDGHHGDRHEGREMQHRHADGRAILRFHTMAPVTGPFVGAAHPVRGLAGGGLPWELQRAKGSLRSDGRLRIKVRGLVLAHQAPVPPDLQGTNPVPQFRGAVSCLTTASPDTGTTISTDPVPASPTGDARIRAQLALPEPCVAPVIFVTSPTNQWFAATGG